ncbi:MAG: (2Fe-2S)-binding protein [Betaproteobacteria bacterium]|nr:(2Fe-2S)-binding protein [Betaproteobacteria bacterium]
MSAAHAVTMTVNGRRVSANLEPRVSLADFLREQLNLTGTHLGCEHGVCGACTVIVDGSAVRACLLFAVQLEGAAVTTVEGLAPEGELTDLQRAFREHHALQCGFCTPGFLTTAHAFLQENARPTLEEVRAALSGNVCRCTGYLGIVDAVLATAQARAQR